MVKVKGPLILIFLFKIKLGNISREWYPVSMLLLNVMNPTFMELRSETNQKQDRHRISNEPGKYYYTSPDTLTCLKTGACVLFIKGNMVFVVTVNTFYTVSFGHDKPKTLWRFSSNTISSLHEYNFEITMGNP